MSSNNYRPIAITTAISKLLELIIQHRIYDLMEISCSQLGSKAGHGWDMAIFSFVDCVKFYANAGFPLFTCSLVASKALDRVNHLKLFEKLRSRGTPMYIIENLSNWYATQEYLIKWWTYYSATFRVTNGMRQGGLLSFILYNLYIDSLMKAPAV